MTEQQTTIHSIREQVEKITDQFQPGILDRDHIYNGWKSGDLYVLLNTIDNDPFHFRIKLFQETATVGDQIFTYNCDGEPEEIIDWFKSWPQNMKNIFLDYQNRYTNMFLEKGLETENDADTPE